MGSNEFNQIGIKDNYSLDPTLLMKNNNIINISCGYDHSFILLSKKKKKDF